MTGVLLRTSRAASWMALCRRSLKALLRSSEIPAPGVLALGEVSLHAVEFNWSQL